MPRLTFSPTFLVAMLTSSVVLTGAVLLLVPSRPGPVAESRSPPQARAHGPWRLSPNDVETTGSVGPSASARPRAPAIAEERRPVRIISYPGPADPR